MEDVTGARFGKLMVIELARVEKKSGRYWLCRCDCGNETTVRETDLRRGNTKSCGCLRRGRVETHGGRYTRLYNIWKGMRKRCSNPNMANYENYGGRGICVCEEWEKSFTAFREWALAHGYREDLTIDRIDNNGNYEPSNCRWVTMKEQMRNKRPRKKHSD